MSTATSPIRPPLLACTSSAAPIRQRFASTVRSIARAIESSAVIRASGRTADKGPTDERALDRRRRTDLYLHLGRGYRFFRSGSSHPPLALDHHASARYLRKTPFHVDLLPDIDRHRE